MGLFESGVEIHLDVVPIPARVETVSSKLVKLEGRHAVRDLGSTASIGFDLGDRFMVINTVIEVVTQTSCVTDV